MQKFSTKKILIMLVVTLLSTFPFSSKVVFASETDGTIDAINKYAWSENSGWINFGETGGDVHVTDSALTGTEPWMVDYGKMTPFIVKAVQDLKVENTMLKAELCERDNTYSWCE